MGILFLNSIFLIIFPIIIITQFVLYLPVAANYELNPGDNLNSHDHNSILASANGMFTLGFFTITTTTYLGIWFTNQDRKVWVANRDNPMIDNGVLMIDKSGTLKVISDITKNTVFNVSVGVVGSRNTRAVLEDSGNFVLYDNTANQTLWQSFDYPTDILLPGMKIGYNLTTGHNLTLTSWFSEEIPASGDFSLRLEQIQNSPQLVIYRRGKLYWTSGEYYTESGYQISEYDYILSPLVSDASGGMFFLYNLTSYTGKINIFQLSFRGQILLLDSGGNVFNHFQRLFCYQIEKSNGELQVDWDGALCAISTLHECRSHQYESVGFRIEKGYWDYENREIGNDPDISYPNISWSDCMERCWNDCKCKGFSINDGTGCKIILGGHSQYIFDDKYWNQIRVLFAHKPLKSKIWIWILVSIAGVLTCALTAPIFYKWIRKWILQAKEKRRRDDYIHQLTGSDSFNYSNALEKGIKDAPDIKIFSLRAILTATNSFSIENKLGQGGYGPVYKGKLSDGREIAIKRLSKTSGQRKRGV